MKSIISFATAGVMLLATVVGVPAVYAVTSTDLDSTVNHQPAATNNDTIGLELIDTPSIQAEKNIQVALNTSLQIVPLPRPQHSGPPLPREPEYISPLPREPDAFAEELDKLDVRSLGPVMENLVLDQQRGGQSLHIEDMRLQINEANAKASMNDNIVFSTATGANAINAGAFAGASGVATVIQNSGNQVIIQNNTIINLDIR